MSAEVCRLPAGVVPNEAEFIQTAIRVIRRVRRRSQPHLVVESFRYWHRLPAGTRADKIVLCDERCDSLQLTYATIAYKFTAAADSVVRAMVAARLQNTFVFSHGFDHCFAIIDRQRQWLL